MGIQHMWAIMTAKELMEMVARGNWIAVNNNVFY